MRKIEILADTPTEFEFRDTAADIQRRREERGGTGTERGNLEGGNYTLNGGLSGQKACKDRQK